MKEIELDQLKNAIKWANSAKVSESERDAIFGFCEKLDLPVAWDMVDNKICLLGTD